MKLLILTQIVDLNDDVLGFMHGWIAAFAEKCERVTVICLKKGEIDLPANVKVLSLGKEQGRSRIKYLANFYKYIWRERKNYDIVLAHMNYEYVSLGGIFWRILGKKIALWYAHGQVPLGLKMAEKLVQIIFTSTKSGCRLTSDKIKVIGQGIDVEKFKCQMSNVKTNNRFKIITVGRISPSKDYKTLVRAVEILKNKGVKLEVEIIGGPAVPADQQYLAEVELLIKSLGLEQTIKLVGPVANRRIIDYLQSAALFVNMGLTGSLDKAMVEAMACELPVLTCNEAMLEVLGDYREKLMYPQRDFQKLAERIEYLIDLPLDDYLKLGRALRNIVIKKHSLDKFIDKILKLY
jgi:glycosyltransferase involved in cell wall biosynthesis